jgi:hypothetical protein
MQQSLEINMHKFLTPVAKWGKPDQGIDPTEKPGQAKCSEPGQGIDPTKKPGWKIHIPIVKLKIGLAPRSSSQSMKTTAASAIAVAQGKPSMMRTTPKAIAARSAHMK